MCYNNWFVADVFGSRQVTTLVKYKAHGTTPHIEKKEYHEKLGKYTQRRLAVILKIRSKFFLLHIRRQRHTTNNRYRSQGTIPYDFYGF